MRFLFKWYELNIFDEIKQNIYFLIKKHIALKIEAYISRIKNKLNSRTPMSIAENEYFTMLIPQTFMVFYIHDRTIELQKQQNTSFGVYFTTAFTAFNHKCLHLLIIPEFLSKQTCLKPSYVDSNMAWKLFKFLLKFSKNKISSCKHIFLGFDSGIMMLVSIL